MAIVKFSAVDNKSFDDKSHTDLYELFTSRPLAPEYNDTTTPVYRDIKELEKEQQGVLPFYVSPADETKTQNFTKTLGDEIKLTLGNEKVNTPPGLSFEPGIQELKRQEESDALVAADNAEVQRGIALATAEKAKANSPSLSSMQKVLLGLGAAGAGYGLYKYLTKKKKKPVIYQNQLEYNT